MSMFAFLGTPVKAVLGVVVLVAAGVRLAGASAQMLHYDEHWHMFIATVQPWTQFVTEVHGQTAPPLSFLVLRSLLSIKDSPLLARMIAVVPGILSVPVFFSCASRLGLGAPLSLLGALALALAPAHVAVSIVTRGYSLATLFLLLAYASLLMLLRASSDGNEVNRRHLLSWILWSSLAMWTEYSAWFVVAAMGTLLLLAQRKLLLANLRILLASLASMLCLVGFLAGGFGFQTSTHITPFLPAGEPLWRFGLLGFARDLHLFSSLPVGDVAAAVVLLLAAATLGPASVRCLRCGGDIARASAPLISGQLLLVLVAMAWARLYPFGGELRHQFVLFPYLLLSLLLVVDLARASLGRSVTAAGYGIVLIWGVWALHQPLTEEVRWNPQMSVDGPNLLKRVGAEWIYAPTYSAIALFGSLPGSRWSAQGDCAVGCQRFLVTMLDGSRATVLKDSVVFLAPRVPDTSFKSRVSEVMTVSGRDSLWVYPARPGDLGELWRAQGLDGQAAPAPWWK